MPMRVVDDVFANRAVVVDGDGPIVRPALAHRSGLRAAQAGAAVADQTIGDAVAVLVKHHVAIHRAVAVRGWRSEEKLLHARALTIGRRREVCVVGAGAVLRFSSDRVVAGAAAAEVIRLEVSRRFR